MTITTYLLLSALMALGCLLVWALAAFSFDESRREIQDMGLHEGNRVPRRSN